MGRKMPPHIVLPNGMWRFVKRGKGSPTRKSHARRRVNTMVRRHRFGRRRSSRSGFGMGRLLSMRNILFTLGGAYVGAKVLNLDPKLAAAAGGFLGAGPVGAVAGYVAGPVVLGMMPGVSSGSANSGAW